MDTFKVGGIAILAACAAVILRSLKPEWSLLIRISAFVTISAFMLPMLYTTVSYVKELAYSDGMENSFSIEILLKALSIAILTHISSSVCKDAGEVGVAGFVETAGKLEILLLSFPLIKDILELSVQLLRLGG